MSSSFEFDTPDRFIPGTVGEPGARIFYLQGRQSGRIVSLRLEKQQVAALGEYLVGLLADLPEPARAELTSDDALLLEPVVPEWVVGSLGAAYVESDDRVVVAAEEFVPDDADPAVIGETGRGRFVITREQAAIYSVLAARLVEAGRPLCPFCDQPIDPDGHACPKSNGKGRH